MGREKLWKGWGGDGENGMKEGRRGNGQVKVMEREREVIRMRWKEL